MFIDGIELSVLYVNTNGVPGNLGAGFRGLRSGSIVPAPPARMRSCAKMLKCDSVRRKTSPASRATSASAPSPGVRGHRACPLPE